MHDQHLQRPQQEDTLADTAFEDEIDDDADDVVNEKTYASLDQAFKEHRIPLENRELIRRAVAAVGIERYAGTSTYIKAYRQDGGPNLRIRYGYTTGFISREEAESVENHIGVWQSSRKDLWGITHPVNNIGGGNTGPKRTERDYGTCTECFTQYRPNGACACL